MAGVGGIYGFINKCLLLNPERVGALAHLRGLLDVSGSTSDACRKATSHAITPFLGHHCGVDF